MRERLGLTVELHEAGYDRMQLNVIASPLQGCRDVFDLMPTATQDDWATIATRLTQGADAPSSSGPRRCASRPTAGS